MKRQTGLQKRLWEMRDFFSRLHHNFFFNLKTLLVFEVLYRIFSLAVMLPLFRAAFFGIIKLCGTSYLTGESLSMVIKNPLFLILSGVLLLAMAIYSMIDISAVIFIYDRSEEEKKAGVLETIVFSFKTSIRVFSHHNFLIALVTLFMIPFLNLGVGLVFIGTVRLPDFWVNYIVVHPVVFILVVCGVFLMIYFLINWLFSFSYFTLEKKRFRLSRHYSRLLSKGHILSMIIALIICQLFLLLRYYLLSAGGGLMISLLNSAVSVSTVPSSVLITVLAVLFGGVLFLLSSMALPLVLLVITALFYRYKKERGYEVKHAPEVFSNKDNGRYSLAKKITGFFAAVAAGVFVMIIASDYTYGLSTGRYPRRMEGDDRILITAHRGASSDYPENTCSAVKGAYETGADFCEIDVQKTRDGRLAVIHDKNLKRLTGMNKKVWELDMEDIKALSVKEGASLLEEPEHIAELSEVLSISKETGLLMNVEIKPHGHGDSDIAELVVSEINRAGCRDNCFISSMKRAVLKEVKRIDPSMKTVYISSLAFGDPSELDFADGISVEVSFVSRELASLAHRAGMEVSAWTVNDIGVAREVIASGVDNIITDDVMKIKKAVENAWEADRTLGWFTDFTSNLLR